MNAAGANDQPASAPGGEGALRTIGIVITTTTITRRQRVWPVA